MIGIDANPYIIQYAQTQSPNSPEIAYKTQNILSPEALENTFDIACLNSVCHHFSNEELQTLLSKLVNHTKIAVIINDLHRHWLPYFFVRFLTQVFHFSYLSKHDGPLSVLRAFQKKELISLFSGLKNCTVTTSWKWPFRWQVIARKHNL